MTQLFVCEKPSVARDLADVVSGGYSSKTGYYEGKDGKLYTYAYGHLVTCVMPDSINDNWGWKGDVVQLPFFLKHIPLKVIDDPGIKKQYKIVTSLMKRASVVYIATDAGREGEHIFRKIYAKSGLQKPLKRLWIKDVSKEGMLKAYNNMKDGSEYEGLATAGRLREEADLMIGLNSTMLLTKLSKSKSVLSLGRVQTPTLSMVVKRDESIEGFKKVVHFSIRAEERKGIKFELVLDKDTYLLKNEAEKVKNELSNRHSFEVSQKKKEVLPEKLFDLTELQKYMNTKHKWSASHTLKITQALYEKKLVTYPRTGSQYIANDTELPGLLRKHANDQRVKKIIEQGYVIEPSFIDPTKVTDHEAIIITNNVAKDLVEDENTLYKTILTRFIAAFYPKAIKNEVTAKFKDQDNVFKASESTLFEPGWKSLFGETKEDSVLNQVKLNDVGEYEVFEKETKPPTRYTEATLLNDMLHAAKFLEEKNDKKLMNSVEGIGTPATRAEVIELLVRRGFIKKQKNQLISTPLGRELINMMPDQFSLYNVQLTAYFESLLAAVEKKEINEKVFYEELEGLVNQIATEIKTNIKEVSRVATEKVEIAKCPKCQKPIYENNKSYACSGFKDGCKVSVWKNGLEKLGKKNITKNEATKLLTGSKIKVTLKSKKGTSYKKEVILNLTNNWIEFAK